MPTLTAYTIINNQQYPLVEYTYSVSSTNTTTTVTGTPPSVNTSGVSVRVIVDGTEIWNEVNHTRYVTTNTKSFTRTTSAQSKEIKLVVVDVDGTQTPTGTISVPALASYTISYNANGHGTAPSSQTKYYGTNITLRAGITATGYSFKRWNTNSTDTGTGYNASATYSSNAAATLYAIWNRTITYNANGGTSPPSAQTAIATSAITITTSTPTYTGFTFKDWNTKTDGTGTTYASGGSYAANNASITLYARWNHTVSFNANGGSGAPSAQTALKTSAITLSTTKPTLSGYTFKDWNTKADGTGTTYASGGTFAANTVNTTLYARWNRTITYNANGGSGEPSAQTELKTTAITLSSTQPTLTGYTFKDWNTNSSGTGTTYASGGSYPANTASATLYARWNRTVTYNANNGFGAPASQTALKDNAITLSSTVPTRSGYRFKLWNTEADGSGTDYASGGNYPADNPNVTLYAQWEKLITAVTIGNVTAIRTDDVSGLPSVEPVETDEGEYVYIKVPYTVDGPAAAAAGGSCVELTVTAEADSGTDPTVTRVVYQASKQEDTQLSGTFSAVAGVCNTDIRYTFTVTVSATNSTVYQTAVTATKTIITPTAFYTIDVKAGGHGIHFGGAAVNNGFWVSMPASFNNKVSVIDNTIDLTVTPPETYYGSDPAFYLRDKNDDTIGYFTPLAVPDTDGMYGIQIGTHRNIEGTDYWHSVWLGIKDDGSEYVSVTNNSAWRSALGVYSTTESDNRYVNVTGDTMTGGLTFDNVTNAIYYKGAYASYPMIKFKDGSDNYGNGIVIGGGGLTCIGGGESADAIAGSISSGNSEQLCLCNDAAIDIYTNCQNGAASAVHTTISGRTFSGRAVCLKDQTNDNDTYLNYGAAALNWSDTTFFAAWNGYSLRAINKSQITPANIGAVSKAGDTLTGSCLISVSSGDARWQVTNTYNSVTRTAGILSNNSGSGVYIWSPSAVAGFLCHTDGSKKYFAGMDFTNAASVRSSIGAAAKSWTALGNVTGTTPLTLNLTNYSEIYVSGNYSTVYRSGMLIPKNFISATEYEWYLGGGNKGSSSPSGRRGVFKLTLTKFTPVLMTVDGVDYSNSTCNWYVYAR